MLKCVTRYSVAGGFQAAAFAAPRYSAAILRLAVGSGMLGALWPQAGHAQEPILHEYVPNVDPAEAALAVTRAHGHASPFVYRGEVITPPPLHRATSHQSAQVATLGDGEGQEEPGQRSLTFQPDRLTALEGTLQYQASFTPTIAPFKRVTALDTVGLAADGRTPVLRIRDPSRRTLAVTESLGADGGRARDQFWGLVTLDLSAGRRVPLPSVAPEMRLLGLESEPHVALRVSQDGADNYYVTAIRQRPRGPITLRFLCDAPRAYFAAELPEGRADALASEVGPLPRAVRQRALALAAELKLAPERPLGRVLAGLTRHFRSFEESSEPPKDSGDILADLVRAKKGICRHRSYGFVVLALALGIPSRFVQNEAHSWVEVKLPKVGWMRIDLGGAAHGLEAVGSSERPLYRPELADPLPRPPAYERSYSQLQGPVEGLRPQDLEALRGRWLEQRGAGAPARQSREARAPLLGTPNQRPQLGLEAAGGRERLRLVLRPGRYQVVHGEELKLAGRVLDGDAQGVPGMRIEVSLAAEDGRKTMLLGMTVSGRGGRFGGAFGVPLSLPPGSYRLHVIAPGNRHYAPAIAP